MGRGSGTSNAGNAGAGGRVTRSRRGGARWTGVALAVAAASPSLGWGVRVAAAQVAVAVSAPATVAARSAVLVRVEVTAPAQATVRLVPPAFAPFTLARSDRAPVDTAGLAGRQRLEWRFVLRSAGAGTYAFEPFAVDVEGAGLRAATFRSRAWSVAVLPAPTAAGAAGGADPRPDAAATDPGRLAFDARVAPERVYVGEQATLELRVGIGGAVRARLRRSPEFAFPTVGGVVSYDLRSRHASAAAGDVHVYRRALFPVAPGPVEVPPAQLVYALTPDDDPFGLEQRVTARTTTRQLVAVAPPTAGRPAAWDGAVGRYQVTARVDTTHARVGDAVVYTLRVEGTGNVMLLPRPRLTVPWADVSPAAERVAVDTSGELAGGAKEFDWLLTPRAAGPALIPAAHYAYFDPRAGYAFADAPAVPVRVAPGAGAASPVAAATPRPAARRPERRVGVLRRWDGERGTALVARRTFWLALAAVPLPGALWLLGAAAFGRWRARERRPSGARADGTPSARANAAESLHRFHAGLAALLDWPSGAHALGPAALERALRRSGVGGVLAAECAASADAWARTAYGAGVGAEGSTAPPPPERLLARVAADLGARRSVTPESSTPRPVVRVRRAFPRHVLPGVAVGAALLAVAFGAPQLRPERLLADAVADRARAAATFEAGVAAYTQGDVERARDLFVAAADAAPAVPAAWFNAGTAAWASGDTASAAFAWQRAARLAPGAPDIRARLDELPAGGTLGAFARADPALVGALALAAAALTALWTLASAVAYTRGAGATPSARAAAVWRGAPALYVVALVLAAGAALAHRAKDPGGLGVVRATAALRPEPNAQEGGAATAATGELARVLDDEGGWVRVRLDGGREGWLRAAQLAPLDRPL